MTLPKATQEKKLDLRTRDKYLREEKISTEEITNYLKSLENDENNLKEDDLTLKS